MIRVRDDKQLPLFDPWGHLGPRRRKLLDSSWPGLFKALVLPRLPVDVLASCFRPDFGHPTKELFTVLGCLVLQQMHDLTDDEATEALSFSTQWHYALDIRDDSDQAKYLCVRTLRSMRYLATERGLDSLMFERATVDLAHAFGVNAEKQRLDSVHLCSDMRRLGRLRLFTQCIHKFLKNLKRQKPDVFAALEKDFPELVARYLAEKALSVFSMVKPSASEKTLAGVAADLVALVERFGDDESVGGLASYKLLCRVMADQMDSDGPVRLKPPKKVAPGSLQNPSDPDAGYNAHKGQGYHAQVMETYDTEPAPEDGVKPLRLATHVTVEPAHVHDVHALVPAIESAREKGLSPETVLADSLYGSDENVEKAQGLGVELVAPAMPGKPEKDGDLTLADCSIKDKRVAACPRGLAPAETKNGKNGLRARFDANVCAACPDRRRCPAKPGKRWFVLAYDAKAIRLALRRAHEKTDAFKDRYRWRAGVEATFSELDRRTGVKHLRVRGMAAVRFCVFLKVLGLNILRAARHRAAKIAKIPTLNRPIRAFFRLLGLIRDRGGVRHGKKFAYPEKPPTRLRFYPPSIPWQTQWAA